MRIDFLKSYGTDAAHCSLPLGGLGAGMVSFAHNGALESVAVKHHPDMFNDPVMFASIHCAKSKYTRVLQGQVPYHKVTQSHGTAFNGSGSGRGNHYGLPCFPHSDYRAAFPFAQLELRDDNAPLQAQVTAWSPFIPGDDQASGLPLAVLEYEIKNTSNETQDFVFAYHIENFLGTKDTHCYSDARALKHGFQLEATPYASDDQATSCCPGSGCCEPQEQSKNEERALALASSIGVTLHGVDNTQVDCGWFRSGWFDKRVALWDSIKNGSIPERSSHGDRDDAGASVGTNLTLKAGESKKITVLMTWYTPQFRAWKRVGDLVRTWYASAFKSHTALTNHVVKHIDDFRARSLAFCEAIHVNDMPAVFCCSASRNLAIFKSPSFLRDEEGRLWGWEGCHDDAGCCNGSCTHVYNYAQALAFLFPHLERGMRDIEFGPSQEDDGFQHFRANLPFSNPFEKRFHAAADGQLGGIIRIYRDWQLSGDTAWLRSKWKAVRQSLDYCIKAWDLERNGRLAEPHHNTYDIEFWGEDGLCSSMYAGALDAAIKMAQYLDESSEDWQQILDGVSAVIKDELFNGWIRQKVHWKDLKADDPITISIGQEARNSPEAIAIIEQEGPRYQYGDGVLIDGALGCQIARIAGLGAIIDEDIERAHVDAIMTHNFKASLKDHACFQRPSYAIADEAGTIMCSWPAGGRLSMPFPYSDEIWTGCEHQFAAHLLMLGRLEDALKVEEAVNGRYNGRVRNPFNEIECGHFYIRALASYGLVPAFSGAHYNGAEKVMHFKPIIEGDFKSFFAIGSAWGHIGVRDGQPFLDLIEGELEIKEWQYDKQPALA